MHKLAHVSIVPGESEHKVNYDYDIQQVPLAYDDEEQLRALNWDFQLYTESGEPSAQIILSLTLD